MLWFITVLCAALFFFGLLALALGGTTSESWGSGFKRNYRWWHLGMAIIVLWLIPWGSVSLAKSVGSDSVLNGYQQFLNGALLSADVDVTPCHRDGGCSHTYDCDSYIVLVTHSHVDANGDTYYTQDPETRWHSCPYVTTEYTYTETGTFGFKNETKVLAGSIFARSPQEWRSGHGVPSGVPQGPPLKWLRDRAAIAAGNSPPITDTDKYPNYILASQNTILKAFSDDVEVYLARKLLPEHTAGLLKNKTVYDYWSADKMAFVGFTAKNAKLWQLRLMRFNAALGMTLQGDMHVLAVPVSVIESGDSERYANALKAYWQGNKLGKKALAKNTIMVVLGVDRSTGRIVWARAKTGMPFGNGPMLSAIETRLKGKPFDPTTVLGKIRAQVDGKTINYVHSNGVLDKIVFSEFLFARARMGHPDSNNTGNYTYLKADINLPGWAGWVAGVLAALGGVFGAFGVIASSPDGSAALNGYSRSNYY